MGDLNVNIQQAKGLVLAGKFQEAREILLKVLSENKIDIGDENESTFYFQDIFQFIFYNEIINKGRKNKWLNTNVNIAYSLLGYIAVEYGNYEEAIEYLDRAIQLNPMDVGSIIEKSECFMRMNRYDDFLNCIQKAYEVCILPEDLARYFRKIGYYYAEIGKFELSYAINQISLIFEHSDLAMSEMMYNREKIGDENFKLNMTETVNILKENNIPFAPRKEVVALLFSMYKDLEFENKMPNVYAETKRRLYIFTGDERFKNNI